MNTIEKTKLIQAGLNSLFTSKGSDAEIGLGDVVREVAASGGGGSSAWGAITGTLSDQTDLQSALDDLSARSVTVIPNAGNLTGTYIGDVFVNGSATLTGNVVVIGDLIAKNSLTNTVGYSLTVYGDCMLGGAILFTPSSLSSNQGNVTVYGDMEIDKDLAGPSITAAVVSGDSTSILLSAQTVSDMLAAGFVDGGVNLTFLTGDNAGFVSNYNVFDSGTMTISFNPMGPPDAPGQPINPGDEVFVSLFVTTNPHFKVNPGKTVGLTVKGNLILKADFTGSGNISDVPGTNSGNGLNLIVHGTLSGLNYETDVINNLNTALFVDGGEAGTALTVFNSATASLDSGDFGNIQPSAQSIADILAAGIVDGVVKITFISGGATGYISTDAILDSGNSNINIPEANCPYDGTPGDQILVEQVAFITTSIGGTGGSIYVYGNVERLYMSSQGGVANNQATVGGNGGQMRIAGNFIGGGADVSGGASDNTAADSGTGGGIGISGDCLTGGQLIANGGLCHSTSPVSGAGAGGGIGVNGNVIIDAISANGGDISGTMTLPVNSVINAGGGGVIEISGTYQGIGESSGMSASGGNVALTANNTSAITVNAGSANHIFLSNGFTLGGNIVCDGGTITNGHPNIAGGAGGTGGAIESSGSCNLRHRLLVNNYVSAKGGNAKGAFAGGSGGYYTSTGPAVISNVIMSGGNSGTGIAAGAGGNATFKAGVVITKALTIVDGFSGNASTSTNTFLKLNGYCSFRAINIQNRATAKIKPYYDGNIILGPIQVMINSMSSAKSTLANNAGTETASIASMLADSTFKYDLTGDKWYRYQGTIL